MTMTITMRREELFEAEAALSSLGARELDLELSLVIAKNKRIIGQQTKDLKEALKPKYDSKEEETRQKEFDESQFRLTREHQGDPQKLEKSMAELQLKYADELFRRRKIKEVNDRFIQEETDTELYEIPKSLLPETIKANDLGPMVLAVIADSKPVPLKKKKK